MSIGSNTPNNLEASSEFSRNEKSYPLTREDILDDLLDEKIEISGVSSILDSYQDDPTSFLTGIKVSLKDKKKSLGKKAEHITDGIIDDLSQSELSREVMKKTRGIVELRGRALYLLKTHYPDLQNQDDWESKLIKHIKYSDQSELSDLTKKIKSSYFVKNFLIGSDLSLGEGDMNFHETKKFSEVFHDIDSIAFSSPEFKKFVQDIFARHQRFGTIPKSSEIRKILEAYKNSPNERIKEILQDLGTTLPLRVAYEYKLIDNTIIDRHLTQSYGDIYANLTLNEKQDFQKEFVSHKSVDTIRIEPDDLIQSNLKQAFQDKNLLKRIANDILETQAPHETNQFENLGNVLAKAIKDFPDEEDHHVLFTKYVVKTVKNSQGRNISGLENFAKGSIVEFHGGGGQKQYFEILRTHDDAGMPIEVDNGQSFGVEIRELPVENGVLRTGQETGLSYDVLYGFFSDKRDTARVLTQLEFQKSLTNSPSGEEGKIFDARELLDTNDLNKQNIALKLDQHDREGSIYGFEEGTYFSAPEEGKDGALGDDKIWKVVSLDSDGAEILSEGGTIRGHFSYEILYSLAEAGKLKRKHKVSNIEGFLAELKKDEFGKLRSTAEIKDGIIVQKNKDSEGKEIDEPIRVFEDDSGSHIRIDGIDGSMITFGEYEAKDDKTKVSAYAEKHGTKKAFEAFYKPRTMTHGAFLEYIRTNKLKASKNDIIDVHAHDHHDHEHSHVHGSLLSRLGKMQNFASMWKGLELIWHSFEHTLEKGAKLDAARFAMKLSKFIPLDSVEAQIYADIVDGSKETVEKYKKKIANLPGPKGRWKCIHIAHNLDARPEEVMAAIQFMVSSYGHLYAEDIKHYQPVVTPQNLVTKPMGYYSFLDAFIHSTNLPGGIVYWRQKAYEKAKPEVELEGEPPEEQLLHALFKSIDGNPEKYPYAASVVKAIGGPGGFEKDWKFDGTKNAIQKGRDQTTMVNAQGRLNKAVGYLTTHEFYKAIGSMEKVAGKIKVPKYQALPFIWATGGYSKFASPTALQDLKNYAEMGFSFHGYSFLRRESDNMIYRETVRLALSELAGQGKVPTSALDEFNKICDRMDHGPEDTKITDNKYDKISPPKAMMFFWQKYCDQGLHDMLQGHDGWITKMAGENSTVEKYRTRLLDGHGSQLKNANIPTNETGSEWYEEHGLGMNGIFREGPDGLMSIYSSLNKIKLLGPNRGGKPMDPNHKEKIWDYLVKRIIIARDASRFYGATDLQKKQYMVWRKELIDYFSEQLSAATIRNDPTQMAESIRQYPYFRDFEKMGIDPRAIFLSELVDQNAEADYEAWINGGRNTGIRSASVIDAIKGKTQRSAISSPPSSWRDSDDIGGARNIRNDGSDLTDSD